MLTDISGSVFGEGITNIISWIPSNLTTANNITVKTNQKLFKGHTKIKHIEGLTLGDSVTDISSWFEGCTELSEDFDIPSRIVNCTNTFKGCVNMTHVHSNWENEYENEIVATDCYAGCTEITHIDGKDIGKSNYVNGLDNVPPSWGGYGFYPKYTCICDFNVDGDKGLTLQLGGVLYDDKIIDWGDGSITYGTLNHTYASAGIYTVKGKYWFNNQNLNWAFYVSKIIKTPEVPIDGYYKFNKSKYLTYANLTNATFTNARSTFNAYECKSVLKTIIFNNTYIFLISFCG